MSTPPYSPAPRPPARPATARPVSRATLLEAARLGRAVAAADRHGRPEDAASAFTAWRRLRGRTTRQPRQLLRVALDTGYGQEMAGAGRPV